MSLEEIAKGAAWTALSFGNGLLLGYFTASADGKKPGITPLFLLPSAVSPGWYMSQYGPLPLYLSWAGSLAGAAAGYAVGSCLWHCKNRPLLNDKEKKELDSIVEEANCTGANYERRTEIINKKLVPFCLRIIRRNGAPELMSKVVEEVNWHMAVCMYIEKAEKLPEGNIYCLENEGNPENGVLLIADRPDYHCVRLSLESDPSSGPKCPFMQLVPVIKSTHKREYHTAALADAFLGKKDGSMRLLVFGSGSYEKKLNTAMAYYLKRARMNLCKSARAECKKKADCE